MTSTIMRITDLVVMILLAIARTMGTDLADAQATVSTGLLQCPICGTFCSWARISPAWQQFREMTLIRK